MHGLCVMDVTMRKLIARTEDHTVNGLNLALAGILFLSPWLFGFSDRVYLPHLIVGLFEIGTSLMTRTRSSHSDVHGTAHRAV